MKTPDIIIRGKANGEGMIVHYQTTRGTDVFGLGVPNISAGSDWDLGPTWCYLVCGENVSLIDTGRFGNFEALKTLLRSIQIGLSDIDRVIVTHHHEDHDGNLADILAEAQPEIWAHSIYPKMIAYHPHIVDGANHPEMPGSCRLCNMPESFAARCQPYLKKRSSLSIDVAVDDRRIAPGDILSFVFTPGHTADSICIILEDEVIFTGDTLLPDITPQPSLAHAFEVNRRILPDGYRHKNIVYGLMNYIDSLRTLASLPTGPFQATFPAHRLFYNSQFNLINDVSDRARKIIRFHIDRCRDILATLKGKPLGIDEIASEYFSPSLLGGTGKYMARSEIRAHVEVMEEAGDIRWTGANGSLVECTGSNHYLELIEAYLK